MKPSGRSPFKNRFGSHGRAATLILLTVSLAGAPLARGGKKNDAADYSGADAKASPTPGPPKFNVPIPVNHDAQGVKLPYFDRLGKLQMYFNIKQAFRMDNDHLRMKNAYMQTYDEKGMPDAAVFMTSSVLDLNTRIVTSDVPVTVSRTDFEILGKKMVFNTQTHIGHMSGHVRMVIYNRQEMSQTSPSPGPSAPPRSAPTPP